jgi:hypothetical protein
MGMDSLGASWWRTTGKGWRTPSILPHQRRPAGVAPPVLPILQGMLWVKPLAAMPRIAGRAATAEMVSGSDCAKHLRAKSWNYSLSNQLRRVPKPPLKHSAPHFEFYVKKTGLTHSPLDSSMNSEALPEF